MDNHRFVFIGGLHRSGTSILHRSLSEHPDTSGFANTAAQENEGQHLQTVFPAAKHFGGPGRFAFHPAASLMGDPALRSDASRERLLREWGAHYDLSKPVLLEKSPPNLIRSGYFRDLFPGSRFVFIVRHPAAVALATRKWSKSSLVELILHWAVAHRRMAADCTNADDTLVVRYEDFVAEPQAILGAVAAHAGLSRFSPEETVSDRNSGYFDRWLGNCQAETELLQSAFPEVVSWIESFGYALQPPFVTPASSMPLLHFATRT